MVNLLTDCENIGRNSVRIRLHAVVSHKAAKSNALKNNQLHIFVQNGNIFAMKTWGFICFCNCWVGFSVQNSLPERKI
jgi:hypothetical protein